jgi:hypothetical protein
VILLHRTGRYPRRSLFQELGKAGFDYVISVESSPKRYDVEELSGAFPFVRFILLSEPIGPGDQINLAVSELPSPLFFVLWNDLRIMAGGGAARIAARLTLIHEEEQKNGKSPYQRLCTVPVIQNSRFETLPTLIAPAVRKRKVKTLFFSPQEDGLPSLYPFDGVGIYDRERFIRLGGFDGALKSTYWQFMDFGFRSWLWGEEIRSTQQVKITYDGDVPAMDNTTEASYLRFYLKNLAPIFRGDSAHLPLRRFPGYFLRSGEDFFAAWQNFSESRRWVTHSSYRWQSDALSITDRWEYMRGNSGS